MTDLKETIARVKEQARVLLSTGGEAVHLHIRADDLTALLDAAEAAEKLRAELVDERREMRELQYQYQKLNGGGPLPSGYRGARDAALEEAATLAEAEWNFALAADIRSLRRPT